ncbi:thioredoxin-like protein [Lipomyces japonicus]|uniref:thioredoxin-like protein n=1 Tax=Lipomyces japonicus TaxID=56871 RepID=UPI0034CD9F15
MPFTRTLLGAAKVQSFTATNTIRSTFGRQLPISFAITRYQQARYLSEESRKAIEGAIASAPVVLFMKGVPEAPQCGFSRATIQLLSLYGVDPEKFAAFNVLEDNELRQGIKEFSDWPTIPQLYVNQEFIGGCDIVLDLHRNGEFEELLEKANALLPQEQQESSESTSDKSA